jgi:hypothetical protein
MSKANQQQRTHSTKTQAYVHRKIGRMDFRETVREGVDWMQLAQDGVQWLVFVNTVINLRVP